MDRHSETIPAVLTEAARAAVAALRAAYLLQFSGPKGGQPVVSLAMALGPHGQREGLFVTFDPLAEAEEVRSDIPACAFPGFARIGVDHRPQVGFAPCDPETGAALDAAALRHARAMADLRPIDFVLTPAARGYIDTLRALWETAVTEDPPGLPLVSWKLSRTREGGLLGSVAVLFQRASDTPRLQGFVQRSGDLELIYQPWETEARPDGLMVIDYAPRQGFFLRDPATGAAYPTPPSVVPADQL